MLFGGSSLIGLDVGTSSIKLVELEQSRKDWTLVNFGFVSTPPGSISSGEILDTNALTGAILQLIQKTGVKSRKVCTGVWGTGLITKKIAIPRIDENLLDEQLRWEAEQYIPFDINDINLGYQVLKNANAGAEQMSILLVAAKKDYVSKLAEVVEAAGLECAVMDVAGFALANCFEANYSKVKTGTVGLLNVGAGVTNFVVIHNGEVVFARDLPVGGNTYTNEIQKTMGISVEEAESLKISAGTGQPVPKEITEIVKQTNETLIDEFKRSFDFFLSTFEGASFQNVYVSGGGLGIPGLYEQMAGALGAPVDTLNPFQKVSYARDFTQDYIAQISPYVSVAMGFAMRQAKE